MSTTKLAEAARAVIDRWDSPAWKDAPHTGEYIHALRQALASYEAAQAEAKPADPGQLAYDIWAAANRPNVGIEGQIEGIQAVLDREVKPAPAVEPVKLWCDTCEGTGKVWEEFQKGCHVGGDHDCPDCDGKGYTLRAAPVAPAPEPLTDAKLFKIAQSMPQRPWGIGSRHCDAIAYARAAIAASKGGAE